MRYRKKGEIEAVRYSGQSLQGVSVSDVDNPAEGGWVANDPDHPEDRWFIANAYFAKHYEEVM